MVGTVLLTSVAAELVKESGPEEVVEVDQGPHSVTGSAFWPILRAVYPSSFFLGLFAFASSFYVILWYVCFEDCAP